MRDVIRKTTQRRKTMHEDETSRKGLFEKLFAGKSSASREQRVREYIVYRIRHGARLNEVLKEDYVQRVCSPGELDEILRDPRLIHEEREELERFFEDERMQPQFARRRR